MVSLDRLKHFIPQFSKGELIELLRFLNENKVSAANIQEAIVENKKLVNLSFKEVYILMQSLSDPVKVLGDRFFSYYQSVMMIEDYQELYETDVLQITFMTEQLIKSHLHIQRRRHFEKRFN